MLLKNTERKKNYILSKKAEFRLKLYNVYQKNCMRLVWQCQKITSTQQTRQSLGIGLMSNFLPPPRPLPPILQVLGATEQQSGGTTLESSEYVKKISNLSYLWSRSLFFKDQI